MLFVYSVFTYTAHGAGREIVGAALRFNLKYWSLLSVPAFAVELLHNLNFHTYYPRVRVTNGAKS